MKQPHSLLSTLRAGDDGVAVSDWTGDLGQRHITASLFPLTWEAHIGEDGRLSWAV